MGLTKKILGDDHIIFHVGKDLPAEGSDFLLILGVQGSQGRGVYCGEQPDIKYAGGEHFRQEMDIIPVFCIPMSGQWIRATMKKKGDQIVYNSDEKSILLKNLKYSEVESNKKLRYYVPQEAIFYREPKTKIFNEFYRYHIMDQ